MHHDQRTETGPPGEPVKTAKLAATTIVAAGELQTQLKPASTAEPAGADAEDRAETRPEWTSVLYQVHERFHSPDG